MLASLHFAKVLIACRATTFAKVDYSDYQKLLNYVMYGRFANAPNKYQIYLTKKVAFAACPLPSGGERGRHFKRSCWIKFFYFKISCTFVAYSLKLNSNE